MSPDDPTILVLAGKGACRNVYLERDVRPRHGDWQPGIPAIVLEDIGRADFVLNVRDFRTAGIDLIDEGLLKSRDFRRVEANDHYSLWERGGPSQASRPARGALLSRSRIGDFGGDRVQDASVVEITRR